MASKLSKIIFTIFNAVCIVVLVSLLFYHSSSFIKPIDYDLESFNFSATRVSLESTTFIIPTKIPKYLTKKRMRIMAEIKHFGEKNLSINNYLPERNGLPRKSIIISAMGSGGTFLGRILNTVPGTFYSFEPLANWEYVDVNKQQIALSQLDSILNCQFTENNMNNYLEYMKTHQYYFLQNKRLWNECNSGFNCYNPKKLEEFCRVFPFFLVNVVRLRLGLIEKILQDSTVRVLLLIRDPRGTLTSRKYASFCYSDPLCQSASLLCSRLEEEYKDNIHFHVKYSDRYRLVFYEKIEKQPLVIIQEIFEFFNHKMPVKAYKLISTLFSFNEKNESVFRQEISRSHYWETLPKKEIKDIEDTCKNAIYNWKYSFTTLD